MPILTGHITGLARLSVCSSVPCRFLTE